MFQNKKIACISDIHLGVHQNSQEWHKYHLELAKWFRDSLTENSITDIIIAGDIFHNRHEVGVTTLHVAQEFFDILKPFNIVAITGNHDCYYRDNSKVNSIKVLQKDNLTVYDTLHVENCFNKKVAFCPWGTDLSDIPQCDVVVGHFEITNFKMANNHVCEDGWNSIDLLERCQKVITGHFHLRDERTYEDSKTILYLGSPLELDLGDRDTTKGYTILDLNNLTLKFIENTVSPKHVKIYLSDLKAGKYKAATLKGMIKNNHIRLVVDVKFADSDVDVLLMKLNMLNPTHIRVEYDLPVDTLNESVNEIESISSLVSIQSVIQEYVNALDVQISKKDVYNKCLEYHSLFQ